VDGENRKRKADHLRIVAEEDVAYAQSTLLECVQLAHDALPELALSDIDTTAEFFGKHLAAPLMITSMTGGAERAGELNRELARVAGELGIAFAVGSQRPMLEHPGCTGDFAVREHIPDGVLLGNIGAQQLLVTPLQDIAALVQAIEADGICVHLNTAHELAQDEGEHDFRGLLDGIARLAAQMDGHVLVKETGAGLSQEVVQRLTSAGVSYIDVAGAGGTSWPKVESYRAADPLALGVGKTFSDWGMPTAACIIAARAVAGEETCIIGSGGIASGLDAARAIACGADIAGMARHVLLAYINNGRDGAKAYLARVAHELRATMLLTGCRDCATLRRVPRIYTGVLKDWLGTSEQ
jgi:isopentenyl-diphosphate delta-isomerase